MIDITDQIKVRPLADARADYETSGSRAATKYTESVIRNTDQHSKSVSEQAEKNYNAAMQKVLTQKRRQKMVQQKSSQAKYIEACTDYGASNLNAGISRSGDKWQEGYSPIAQALEATSLPDRTTDPYTNVQNRLVKVIQVQRKAAGKE